MPSYKLTREARQKSARIREVAAAFRRERIQRQEAQGDIRQAVRSTSASEFLAGVQS